MSEEERWKTIGEFPNYKISSFGRVFNVKLDMMMRTSINNFGHVKIKLTSDWGREQYTRSVALLVAEAFLKKPNFLCDQVIVLDGNFTNVAADNLAWRPGWFAWKYTRQLKTTQPLHYTNLHVCNVSTGVVYRSIIEAGMAEGLLFEDVWRSTYRREGTFPDSSVFEIIERV